MSAGRPVSELLREAFRTHARKSYHFPVLRKTLAYAEVNEQADAVGRALRSRGLGSGELVALLFTTSPEFIVSFAGVLAAGGACVPLPHPNGTRALDAYVARLARIMRAGGVRFLLVGDEFEQYATQLVRAQALPVTILRVEALLAEGALGTLPGAIDPSQLALVQYTSGSTAEPKGVALTHANVAAGLGAIVAGIQLTAEDVNGQWLPLHHDMGLVGMLAGTLAGVDHHLWSPESFIRAPAKWLGQFAKCGATIYAGPNFSYASITAKATPADLMGLDLSRWRVAFNGAEVLDARATEAFVAKFEPHGFRRQAMFPVYGLAEATLAATFPVLGAVPHIDWVDRDALANRRLVRPAEMGAPNARGLVAVGAAVAHHAVRIVGENEEVLGDCAVGEIQVRGPAVMRHYFGMSPDESGVTRDGWCRTGDLGYVKSGLLYVSGRKKEMIVVRGSNYYPQDVESIVSALAGVYRGHAIALAMSDRSIERIAVLAEAESAAAPGLGDRIREAVLERLGLADVEVHLLKPRGIQRTTSGKYQRLLMRERLLSGDLTDALLEQAATSIAS